ncbi:MAG: helix-turn-helix domain-containing protein [Elusimicrobia bacterium]|nr:helix-turn-helix domain-containing protein [Elusimicrobiota bacterium]
MEEVAAAAKAAGAWRTWTFDRQGWFIRKYHRLTQAKLAKRSGVSQRRISRIEAGDDVKLSTLRALWRPLGYEPLVIPDALDLPRQSRPFRKGRTMSSKTSSLPARE